MTASHSIISPLASPFKGLPGALRLTPWISQPKNSAALLCWAHASRGVGEQVKYRLTDTPERYEYVNAIRVKVTLKTKTGETIAYTMTTAMLAKSVSLSVDLINNCTGQVFRDLGVF